MNCTCVLHKQVRIDILVHFVLHTHQRSTGHTVSLSIREATLRQKQGPKGMPTHLTPHRPTISFVSVLSFHFKTVSKCLQALQTSFQTAWIWPQRWLRPEGKEGGQGGGILQQSGQRLKIMLCTPLLMGLTKPRTHCYLVVQRDHACCLLV